MGMKIIINCDELIYKKALKEVESEKEEKQGQVRKIQGGKIFHGLHVKCGHLPFLVRLINS